MISKANTALLINTIIEGLCDDDFFNRANLLSKSNSEDIKKLLQKNFEEKMINIKRIQTSTPNLAASPSILFNQGQDQNLTNTPTPTDTNNTNQLNNN
jgi:hypothetical protein